MTSRRAFISHSLRIAVIGGTLPSFLARAANAQPLPALGSSLDPQNTLLVIQLNGGNDGLNTIVPCARSSKMSSMRSIMRCCHNSTFFIPKIFLRRGR